MVGNTMRFLAFSVLATMASASSDYSGALRPQIHYSPPHGFMNDPNGQFLDSKGIYHLYYQCMLHPTLGEYQSDNS